MQHFFTVLGGMGTLASESFVRLLNKRTLANSDQGYLNYILVNHAKIPERTAYILGQSTENPVLALIEDIQQQDLLKPDFYVLTCNTAHAFYQSLTCATKTPILHMPRLTVSQVKALYPANDAQPIIKVCLLATLGTVKSAVYAQELANLDNYQLVLPNEKLQQAVMDLIYRDIKEQQYLNQPLFKAILAQVITDMACDVAILGCTELSLMNEVTQHSYPVIDAQSVLIDETIKLAHK